MLNKTQKESNEKDSSVSISDQFGIILNHKKMILSLSDDAFGDSYVWAFSSAIHPSSYFIDSINLYIETMGTVKWNEANSFSNAVSRLTGQRVECFFGSKFSRGGTSAIAITSGISLNNIEAPKERDAIFREAYVDLFEAYVKDAELRLKNVITRLGDGLLVLNNDIAHDAFLYELKRCAEFFSHTLVRGFLFYNKRLPTLNFNKNLEICAHHWEENKTEEFKKGFLSIAYYGREEQLDTPDSLIRRYCNSVSLLVSFLDLIKKNSFESKTGLNLFY